MDDLHGIFLLVPAWLCIPAALIAFAAVRMILVSFAAKNVVFTGLARNGSVFGGMAALLVLVAGETAAIQKLERRKLYDKQTSIDSIRALSWKEFELLIGEAYRRQGYQVIETGGGGADGGIDLILRRDSETVLVQCKHWRAFRVGVKEIRELFGITVAERADRAIFVTSGVFTRDAKDFANGKPIELLDGEALCQIIFPIILDRKNIKARKVATEADTTAPGCPLCETVMVLRTARRGTNAGSQFWGCSRYPRCNGTSQI
jgi:restriction system protein